MNTIDKIKNIIFVLLSLLFFYIPFKTPLTHWECALMFLTAILLLPFVREDIKNNWGLARFDSFFWVFFLFVSLPLLVFSLGNTDTQKFFSNLYSEYQKYKEKDKYVNNNDYEYNDEYDHSGSDLNNDLSDTTQNNEERDSEKDYAFRDGEFEVGKDIQAGLYRSEASDFCYWERIGLDNHHVPVTLAYGVFSPAIVEIKDTDYKFYSEDCIGWTPVAKTYPDKPLTKFSDGMYIVGKHIEPGLYKASDGSNDACYWERLSGFTGDIEDVIDNGNEADTVNILSSDKGFLTNSCGTWKLVK